MTEKPEKVTLDEHLVEWLAAAIREWIKAGKPRESQPWDASGRNENSSTSEPTRATAQSLSPTDLGAANDPWRS